MTVGPEVLGTCVAPDQSDSGRQIIKSDVVEVAAQAPTEPVGGNRCGGRDLRILDRNARYRTQGWSLANK
jgi:hypothetical protein